MTRIVPMPSFTDPHDPAAAGGSINFGIAADFPPFEAHPVEHSADYAKYLRDDAREDVPSPGEEAQTRDEWTKPQWKDLADEYGLEGTSSLNKDELRDAVEKYETELEDAKGGVQ